MLAARALSTLWFNPTLADLLEEPAQRPELFFAGTTYSTRRKSDLFRKVGKPSVIGNSNGGHLWGTT